MVIAVGLVTVLMMSNDYVNEVKADDEDDDDDEDVMIRIFHWTNSIQ